MKIIKSIYLIAIIFSISACQGLVEDINVDPNKVTDVNGESLFTGIQIADVAAQSGFINWAGGVCAGYFVGNGRLSFIQQYEYPNTDSNTPWRNIYIGVVNQARLLRSGINVTNQDFFYGASMVIEAHAIATASNVFGDVPFSEAGNDEFTTPNYDGQVSVYASLQTLLDDAIASLNAAETVGGINEDLFFDGDAASWISVANTLKARLYMETGDYGSAMAAAQNGISSASQTMKYSPPNIAGGGDLNLLNDLQNSSTFGGDITVDGSYLISLIGTDASSRNNSKTNEVDRAAYYYDGTEINLTGIAGVEEPMEQVSYQENLLIWAEASLRISNGDFDAALGKLNEHRANLRDGVYFAAADGVYDDYINDDFMNGGIENADGTLTMEDALLREIIEERYVTFFAHMLGFSDLRRMKSDPTALQVAVPVNVGSAHPERFLYPFTETNTNSNVPDVSDLFLKTEINQ